MAQTVKQLLAMWKTQVRSLGREDPLEKKMGKTTRIFFYNQSKIPYDYTVEVRNSFKGLDLIDRVPDELWTEVRDMVQETGIKTILMGKKSKMAV